VERHMSLSRGSRRDFGRLILVAIAAAIVILVGIVAVVVWIPPAEVARISGKWIRFALVTGFLVFYELRAYRKLHKSLGFWGIFLGAMAAYLVCVGYFFYYGNGISLVTFVLAGVAQATCFALVIYGVFGVGPSKVNLNL
jgi:hypothetical protein